MVHERPAKHPDEVRNLLRDRVSRFPHWPLFAFALALACLIAIGSLAYRRMVGLADADRWVEHTYQVIHELELVLSDLKDAETGQRGFIITGREHYLEPYHQSLAELDRRLSGLRQLTADNSSQQRRLLEIQRLADLKLSELRDTIELRRNKGLDATLAVVNSDYGKRVMDLIRQQIAEGHSEERRLLGERREHKEAMLNRMLYTFILGGVLVTGLLMWAFMRLQREIGRSRIYAEELVEHREHLEEEVRARTAELEEHRQHLEQQVAERTLQLSTVNKQLQAFTSAASHDLKAPLKRISSFSSLLESNYGERLAGDGLQFLAQIQQNAIRTINLIEDLLAHARVEQAKLHLVPLDLAAAVHAAVQERAIEIKEKGAQVHVRLPESSVLVEADSQHLAQVLRNLLENALKYSAQAHPPVIEIGGEARQDSYRLWVRDNGVGFNMQHHDKIFEVFQRLHSYDQYPGSGVGLALVKSAMERMQGRVWAESEPGKGSTFFLELRIAKADCPWPRS